ncbi:MAG: hypothetical protein BRD55_04260 [Bacteroidetes bacterium SW_9_63_38]|nr:MAG: hypothetical protein BRD55_04260 [Bacteroidetes bacterium SW_9_63_38]
MGMTLILHTRPRRAMSPTRTPDDLQRLFDYNRWASTRLLDAMRAADGVPDRAVELYSHVLRAQDLWYGRVAGTDHADLDLWTTEPLPDCADRLSASTERWQTVLDERVRDGGLDQTIDYTNSKGTRYENTLRDLCTHVVNHGTHHRSQIALVLRRVEIAPPATDYIFYLRAQ